MTNCSKDPNDIFKIILDDILEATDEEIINEAIEDGIDIEKEVRRAKFIFNKCRYDIAKKNVEEKSDSERRTPDPISIQKAREKINDLLKNNPEILKNFTIAARSGENVPDEDVIGLYEDLFTLGVFNEKKPAED